MSVGRTLFAKGNQLAKGHCKPKGGVIALIKTARELVGDGREILGMLKSIALDEDAKDKDRIMAGNALMDRAYGKPLDSERNEGNLQAEQRMTVKQADISKLTPEELRNYYTYLKKILAEDPKQLEGPDGSSVGSGDGGDGDGEGEEEEGEGEAFEAGEPEEEDGDG